MRISIKHWLRILEIKGQNSIFHYDSCFECFDELIEFENHYILIKDTHLSYIDKQAMRLVYPLS